MSDEALSEVKTKFISSTLKSFLLTARNCPSAHPSFTLQHFHFFILYLSFLFSAVSLLTLHSRIQNFLISLFCQIFILAFALILTFPFWTFPDFTSYPFIPSTWFLHSYFFNYFSVFPCIHFFLTTSSIPLCHNSSGFSAISFIFTFFPYVNFSFCFYWNLLYIILVC